MFVFTDTGLYNLQSNISDRTTWQTAVNPPFQSTITEYIGCIAPFEPRKGVSFFIRAAKRITEARGDVEFIVAGSGPAEGELRRLARDLGVRDRLTFVPGDVRAAEVLRNLDVFVFPALRESFGIPALEAMASGVPVVACGSGGTFELVRDGETG